MTAGYLIPLLDTARNSMRAEAQVIRVTVWLTGAGDGCFHIEDLELRIGEIHEQDAHYGGVLLPWLSSCTL